LYSFYLKADLVTVPAKILEEWASKGCPLPGPNFNYRGTAAEGKSLKRLPYKSLNLDAPWESFAIQHDLTTKGIENFASDYRSAPQKSA
jgi:hypothetical protein